MTDSKDILIKKFKDKTAKIAILGQGYVGLPLAVVFAEAGFEVIGIDPDQQKVDGINNGQSHIGDVKSEQIVKLIASQKLQATADFNRLAEVDAVSICVPTPLRKSGDPNMAYILNATEDLAKHLHKGMIVVLESTTYPGTTRELVLDKLTENNDLKVGEDFFLAFSPERVDPGREDWTTINMPKVMGGITPACSEVGTFWYQQALETVISVTSAEVAEMAKLLENTFRMVNIGLVNEMAIMCNRLGVDVWEVVDAAATKPFGFMKFTPGPGIGGHCIPIDPLYLSWKLKSLNYNARFIELASEINSNMARYVVEKVQDSLNDQAKSLNGSDILILGAAYKPDIDDIRESPALGVIGILLDKMAKVSYHDPYVEHIADEGWQMDSVPDLMQAVSQADCVVIITDHSNYDYAEILKRANQIVDTRNALGEAGRLSPKVERI